MGKYRRTYFFSPLTVGKTDIPRLHIEDISGVQVVTPYIPETLAPKYHREALRDLVDELIFEEDIHRFSLWMNSSFALDFSRQLNPMKTIYLKTDEPLVLRDLEDEVIQRSDLVVVGLPFMLEEMRYRHSNVRSLQGQDVTSDFSLLCSLEGEISPPGLMPVKITQLSADSIASPVH
jgi:UDP-galactopyranose mutase